MKADPPVSDERVESHAWMGSLQNQIEAVNRFHLALTGDSWGAAQLGAQTILAARQELPSRLISPAEFQIAVWKIAMRTGRMRVPRRRETVNLSTGELGQEPPLDADDQLTLFRAAQVAHGLSRLPRSQAETLALHIFAGLDLPLVAAVQEKSRAQVEMQLARSLAALSTPDEVPLSNSAADLNSPAVISLAEDLQALAASLHVKGPERQTLQQSLTSPLGPRPIRVALGSRIRQAAWISLALLAAALVLINFVFLPGRDHPVNLTPSPQVTTPNISGFLREPDPQVCQAFQHQLSQALHLEVSLSAPYSFADPAVSDGDRNGTGCELTASAAALAFGSTEEALNQVGALLQGQGYEFEREYRSSNQCPNCYQFPGDWSGSGRLYNATTGRAMLAVGWRPVNSSFCPAPSTPEACNLPPEAQILTLRLILASDPARLTLQSFLNQWQNNQKGALDLLSPALRETAASLSGLDLLAGLPSGRWQNAQVTWKIRDVQNTSLVINVQIHGPAQSGKNYGDLGVLLAEHQGTWLIQEIWSNTFLPTGDIVYGGDLDGRILAINIDDGNSIALTGPGFYYPPYASGRSSPALRTRLSPDGAWLAISIPPGDNAQGGKASPAGTWLVSTRGGKPRQVNQRPLHLAWSPDSQRIVFLSPEDSQGLYLENASGGDRMAFSRVPGQVRGMAWSPTGEWLGVTYSASSGANPAMKIALVHIPNGAVVDLATVPQTETNETRDPDEELYWTKDGSQLWYSPSLLAINIATRELQPLVAQPVSTDLSIQQDRLLQPSIRSGPRNILDEISPDLKQVASAYTEPYVGGAYRVAIQSYDGMLAPLVTAEIGLITAMAWTQDGSTLVAASGIQVTGSVLRINPHTGETRLLHPALFFIGLRSKMMRENLHPAPQTQVIPLTTDHDPVSPWQPVVSSSVLGLSLRVPPSFQISSPSYSSNWDTAISSVKFASPFGYASLDRHALFITLSRRFLSGEAAAEIPYHDVKVWSPFKVGALTAYRRLQPETPGGPLRIVLLMPGSMVEIRKYPFTSDLDPVFQQILESILAR